MSVGHLKYIAEHQSSDLPGTEDMAEDIYRGVEPGYDDYLDDILLQSEKAFQDDDFEDTSQSLLREDSSNHLNSELACSNTVSSSIGGDGYIGEFVHLTAVNCHSGATRCLYGSLKWVKGQLYSALLPGKHLSFPFRANAMAISNRSLDPVPLSMIANGVSQQLATLRPLRPHNLFWEEMSVAPFVIRKEANLSEWKRRPDLSSHFGNCLMLRLSGRFNLSLALPRATSHLKTTDATGGILELTTVPFGLPKEVFDMDRSVVHAVLKSLLSRYISPSQVLSKQHYSCLPQSVTGSISALIDVLMNCD